MKGSLVALVTPMLEGGDLDWRALDALIEWHISEGTDGIVAAGTTGESATLTVKEHCRLVEHVVTKVDGRIPVIAGTGANATHEAIELTESARSVGADACLLVTPYYNKPTQEGLYAHYSAIADQVDIPQILYNVPGRTACDLENETVFRLMPHANIIGIKDATGNLERGKALIDQTPDDFFVYSGDDFTGAKFCLLGGDGVISVTANVVPKEVAEICRLAHAGQESQALALDEKILPIHNTMFIESNPIPVKFALEVMGKVGPSIRLPLTRLSSGLHDKVRNALTEVGVIN